MPCHALGDELASQVDANGSAVVTRTNRPTKENGIRVVSSKTMADHAREMVPHWAVRRKQPGNAERRVRRNEGERMATLSCGDSNPDSNLTVILLSSNESSFRSA